MTASLSARLRRLWLNVHLWLGVGLLVAIVPLSLSGAILVWHDPLDRALNAQRYAVSGPEAKLAPEAYAQAAQSAFGAEATLTQVRLPQKAGDPVVAVGRINGAPGPGGRPRTLNVWIDPPTGQVLARQELAKTFTMVLHRLHGTLLIPEIGRKVVGWLGWAMFISCATGLWLWWPRHGTVIRAMRWRRGASQLFNLHHTVGFLVCLPLAVLSLTGVYISFPQTARALVGAPPQPPRPRPAAPLAQPHTTLAEAIAAAQSQAKGAPVVAINVPTEGKTPTWKVSVKSGEDEKTIEVVDATGQIKADRKTGRSEGGGGPDPISRLMRQIHDGGEMGGVWRTIITLGGVAPAVLAISGVVMWLRRDRREKALRQAH